MKKLGYPVKSIEELRAEVPRGEEKTVFPNRWAKRARDHSEPAPEGAARAQATEKISREISRTERPQALVGYTQGLDAASVEQMWGVGIEPLSGLLDDFFKEPTSGKRKRIPEALGLQSRAEELAYARQA